MKRALKVFGITVASILLLAVALALLCTYTVFNGRRLTGTLNTLLEQKYSGRIWVRHANLDVSRKNRQVSLDLDGFVVFDRLEESPSDTLLYVNKLRLAIDCREYAESKLIKVSPLLINGVSGHLFTAANGASNLDFLLSGAAERECVKEKPESPLQPLYDLTKSLPFGIEISQCKVECLNLLYTSIPDSVSASITEFGTVLNGLITKTQVSLNIGLTVGKLTASAASTSAGATELEFGTSVSFNPNDTTATLSLELHAGNINAKSDSLRAGMENLELEVQSDHLSLTESDCYSGSGLGAKVRIGSATCLTPTLEACAGGLDLILDRISSNGHYLSASLSRLSMDTLLAELRSLEEIGGTQALATGLNVTAGFNSHFTRQDRELNLNISSQGISYNTESANPLKASAEGLGINLDGSLKDGGIILNTGMRAGSLFAKAGRETYINHWPLHTAILLKTDTALSHITLDPGSYLMVNSKRAAFSGTASMEKERIGGEANVDISEFNIEELLAMLPTSLRSLTDSIEIKGFAGASLQVSGELAGGTPVLESARGEVTLRQASGAYGDMAAATEALKVTIDCPSASQGAAQLSMDATDLLFALSDSTNLKTAIEDFKLEADAAFIFDTTQHLALNARTYMGSLQAEIDTLLLNLTGTTLAVETAPGEESLYGSVQLDYNNLQFQLGSGKSMATGASALKLSSTYNPDKEDFLLRFNPTLNASITDSHISMLEQPLSIPDINLDCNMERAVINESRINLGNSNMKVRGSIYNIDSFIEKSGLLTGELYLESEHTDMNELMDLISGYGTDLSQSTGVETTAVVEDSDTTAPNPFIVPEGVDVTIFTNIQNMDFSNHTFHNVGGDITIKDGRLVLQELGFSSSAAEMQLTAIYETPSANDLYTGLDFHLLNIQIDQLMDLIPSVDSVVPMLKSFDGRANFHLAAETRLDGSYMPKMSTLIGAAAIDGQDLVVMDNSVFNSIKRKLFMSRKAENKIDSINVELQVLRNKVDLYPFLVHMDKYKAVIAGRHNINKDLDCSYHISLTECPLPVRFGVNINGPITAIAERPLKHIKLARCQYKSMYRPQKRNVMDERVLNMKRVISETLRSNVK